MKLCVRYGRLSWLAHCVVSLSLISVSSADFPFSSRHSGGEQQDNALQPVAPGGCVPLHSLLTTPRAFIHSSIRLFTKQICYFYSNKTVNSFCFVRLVLESNSRSIVVLILLFDVTESTLKKQRRLLFKQMQSGRLNIFVTSNRTCFIIILLRFYLMLVFLQ